jgi:hypothetical protein
MLLMNFSWPGTSTTGDHAAGQAKGRESQVDGDAAFLLFRQAVRLDAGQCADQGGLAVVDVAGGTDDDVVFSLAHGFYPKRFSVR